MRVLIANSNRNLIGGVERYLQSLIPGLLKRGHEVAILHENRVNPSLETIDSKGALLPAWCASCPSEGELLSGVRTWRPDVVYSQGLAGNELEGALIENYPTVLFAHNYYGTCVSGRKCHSFPRMEACSRRFGPACLLMYYPRRCGGLHPATMWRMYQRQSELNARLLRFRSILVASRHMREEFEANGVDPDKLYLVPLPMAQADEQRTAPARKAPEGKILFVGRVTDVKGVDYLVRALPLAGNMLMRRLSLTIAGDGPQIGQLERLAKALGVAVDFAGWVGTTQTQQLMRETDLLAVPSMWPEPFGLVGIEAGSMGLPAAGYDVGGISDWLIPGVTGEISPGNPPTVEGLAAAIVRALADEEHYRKLSLGAWEMSRRFTLAGHLNRLEPLLDGRLDRIEAEGLVHPSVGTAS